MPPSVGIPLDPMALALDIPNEFSRRDSFSTPRWASLTLVLEVDRRTLSAGRSAIPQDFYHDTRIPYLAGEGTAVAVHFSARWVLLFRREPLWYCAVVEFVAPCQREQSGPFGGTFTREVTVFARYARWRLSVYKYCWVSQPLLLPRFAIVLAFASLPSPRTQTLEHIAAEPLHSSHKMSVRLIAADDWRPRRRRSTGCWSSRMRDSSALVFPPRSQSGSRRQWTTGSRDHSRGTWSPSPSFTATASVPLRAASCGRSATITGWSSSTSRRTPSPPQ